MEEFQFGDSFQEEQQRIKPPKMESYQPEDGMGMPGIDNPNSIPQPQFLDLDNPQTFTGGQQGNNSNAQFAQAMNGFVPPQQPYLQKNEQTKDIGSKINNIFEAINNIEPEDKHGANESYAIGKAITTLHEAIKILDGIDYWIPKGKEGYISQLKQISIPIKKALSAYVGKVEQLK